VLYDGSIGKVLPLFYVRGRLAHAGQVFEGLNPVAVLAEIIARLEVNPRFIERRGNTVAPPPTWLYAKDTKQVYDVSLPAAAVGCLSVLPLSMTPMAVMDALKTIAGEAFEAVIDRTNQSFAAYRAAGKLPPEPLPLSPRVMLFTEALELSKRHGGAAFEAAFAAAYTEAGAGIRAGTLTTIQAATRLVEIVLMHLGDDAPVVVLGLAPPYYPCVNNEMLDAEAATFADGVVGDILSFAATLGECYDVVNYFVALSDLSYAMFKAEPENIACIEGNTPLWGSIYAIPLDIIRQLSMPVCNVGPWGKDLHKATERVNLRDLLDITPRMLDYAIRRALRAGQ
jgi:arginine utilization protein RocB